MTFRALLRTMSTLAPAGAPPARVWLDHVPWLIPAPWATRALLAGDAAALVLLALRFQRPAVAVPAGLGAGFLVLNSLGMAFNDFYLALLGFHYLVALAAILGGGAARWAGAVLLPATVLLGLFTV